MRIRWIISSVLCVALVGLTGCATDEPEPPPVAADSASQRQRHEALGESGLPGAQGVRGALDASDDAAARAASVDSATRD